MLVRLSVSQPKMVELCGGATVLSKSSWNDKNGVLIQQFLLFSRLSSKTLVVFN